MKFEVTDYAKRFVVHDEVVVVYRIRSLINFKVESWNNLGNFTKEIHEGDLGGYVEKAANLSQKGTCWIGSNAIVCGDAVVSEDAFVGGHAIIADYATVSGRAKVSVRSRVFGHAEVSGNAWVYGRTTLKGYAKVTDEAHVYSSTIGGNVTVCDDAHIEKFSSEISGDQVIDETTRMILVFELKNKLDISNLFND